MADAHHEGLQTRRDELQRIVETARVATWTVDLGTGAMSWSSNAAVLLGLGDPPDTLDAFLALLVADDQPSIQSLVDSVRVEGPSAVPDEWQFRVVGIDGQTRWFSARGHATVDACDNIAAGGLVMDITHRRELERQLEAREQMVSGILGASPDGIVVTDLDGRIRFASDGIRDVLGVQPDHLVGRHPFEHVLSGDRAPVASTAEALRAARSGVRQIRVRLRHVDGHDVIADCRVRLLTTSDGAPDGYVTVVRDVTDQALLEAELERARDEAEAANRAKSDYLSRMSHELRTPMNSVLGFAQLLELSDLDESDRDSVDRILSAGRHLLQLIDDVLDIARIEAGHLTISLEPVEIEEVVASAVALLRPQIDERDLDLFVDVAEAGHVMADRQRFAQVLINLLSNAVKYNHQGGEIRVTCSVPEPGRARLAVTDTGPGVPEHMRPRLFEAFDRLDAEPTGVSGTGLGLALSRTLAEAMHGQVGHDHDHDDVRGSTFWLEMPSVEVVDHPALVPDHAELTDRSGPMPADILYIEDNPLNVELVERSLQGRPGTTLRTADSGRAGLAMAHERRPDLVLLDLQLPRMSGWEVLRRFRTDPGLHGVPIVILSADATMNTARRRDGGADAYLTKPLDLAMLHTTIDDLLNGR